MSKARRQFERRGQALVEYALVVPLIVLLVFGLVDFGRLFFTVLTLQNALRVAGRYAVTGNHLPNPANPSQPISRIASITQVAQQNAMGLDVSCLQISSSSSGGAASAGAGGPGDTIQLSLTYTLALLTPIIGQFFTDGVYTFTVNTYFHNEPFPPALQN